MGMDWDCVVVGAGLVGSAAARHLAERGYKVVLVGPGEPADRADTAVLGRIIRSPQQGTK